MVIAAEISPSNLKFASISLRLVNGGSQEQAFPARWNGSGAPGLAGGVSQALVSKGYKGGAVNNAAEQPHQVQPATQVFYNAAAAANAAKIAGYFGATASASTSLPAGHVEVLLGTSVTAMPAGLGSSGAAGAGAPTATATSAGDNGAASGTVTVNSKTPYGTPCVY